MQKYTIWCSCWYLYGKRVRWSSCNVNQWEKKDYRKDSHFTSYVINLVESITAWLEYIKDSSNLPSVHRSSPLSSPPPPSWFLSTCLGVGSAHAYIFMHNLETWTRVCQDTQRELFAGLVLICFILLHKKTSFKLISTYWDFLVELYFRLLA